MTTIAEALALAVRQHRAGNFALAEQLYRQILEAEPANAEARHLLGVLAYQGGKHEIALDCIRQALALNPDSAMFHANLGLVYAALGQRDDAIACYQRAIQLQPDYPNAHNLLGAALKEQGRLDEAVASYRRALELRPDLVEAHVNLAVALQDQGRLTEAVAGYHEALRRWSDCAEAHVNLAAALDRLGRMDEALASGREAIRLRPALPEAHLNLGNALRDTGLVDEAVAAYRRACELRPASSVFHSNLVYALHFQADADPEVLAEEHRRWDERHARPLQRPVRHDNSPGPDRRLRIGYVSPDFRRHPVGRFLLPLLEAHDRREVEVVCYAAVAAPDELTPRFRDLADCWRDVAGLSDEKLAERVRADGIDILVDLVAHMVNSRLLAFARKPAPVQVTYLAYCSTTGLRAMDYRLTDPFLDPPGRPLPWYSEESVWLPETYWCYRPVRELAPPGPPPALAAGHVTFGCLNNFCKVTPPTLAAWRELLGAVPGSRLVLHAHPGAHRDRVRAFFAEGGVEPARVEFVGRAAHADYFRYYERIDIGLDPFPYAGGTTTCDALWMGVPVVSLVGRTAVARAGLSILSNAGLPELAAHTREEYLGIAAGLAADLPRLAALRAGLRARLESSPLTDAPRFARGVEGAFRAMWRRWCAGTRGAG
jgi:predicted O-linked N-acetylglucosamine transferase (SPINDLY family)